MQHDYPSKKFTLDGRLVGDIGEILAEQLYDLKLFAGQKKTHDAESNGRLVQIKTTMKTALTFGKEPEFYLGLRIDESGEIEEIYNGPGHMISEMIKDNKRSEESLYPIPISRLKQLNRQVIDQDRIKRR